MNTNNLKAKVLADLLDQRPESSGSEVESFVRKNRSMLRKVIRRGHSLEVIATKLNYKKRTLQKYLNLAGLFFRKPRVNKGRAIRPYKSRKK